MSEHTELVSSFWQFSIEHYSQNPVKESSLYLQDAHSININILLFMTWLNKQSIYLNQSSFDELHSAIRETDVRLVQLRSHRKEERRGSEQYKQLLAEELEWEAKQQKALIATLPKIKKSAGTCDNLYNYLEERGLSENAQAIELIHYFNKNN